MDSRQRVRDALNHKETDQFPVDFGSTAVTGMHCKVVAGLRDHYGLERRPVRVIDPYQMLGEVDAELRDIIGIDTVPVMGRCDFFNIDETVLHQQVTPWGQEVLIGQGVDLSTDDKGDAYCYPEGDKSVPPSAKMPAGSYFFDAIERKMEVDDDTLDVSQNLEEYGSIPEEDLAFLAGRAAEARATGKAVVASFGGTALGDIATIPGVALRDPQGIRSIMEWYMSTVSRQDFISELFERQTDIAIANYERLWAAIGDNVDVVNNCGTDFGTQNSQFYSVDTFAELWLPHYRRMNDWIHEHTSWKVLKHSCGAIVPLIPSLIESGFDALTPVQINATGMDPRMLKDTFGSQVSFWGGGVDTQKVLPFGTPEQVREHVQGLLEIFAPGGGFVFNAVHNVQANVPIENLVAVIETIREARAGR